MKKGMSLIGGFLGAGVISAVIYVAMTGAGEEIYRSLTEGPPGVRAPDKHSQSDDLLDPDGAIGKFLPAESRAAKTLRARQARLKKSKKQREVEAPPARSQTDMALELNSVNLEDASGRDIRVLISVLKGGLPDQQLGAAKALASLEDPTYTRAILGASLHADEPTGYCQAALDTMAHLTPEARALMIGEILEDRDFEVDGQCRQMLRDESEPTGE